MVIVNDNFNDNKIKIGKNANENDNEATQNFTFEPTNENNQIYSNFINLYKQELKLHEDDEPNPETVEQFNKIYLIGQWVKQNFIHKDRISFGC